MGSGASQRYAKPSSDLPKAQPAQTGRLSNEVPLDESLALSPVDALFHHIAGQAPVAFLKSIDPVEALGLIPKVKVKAETTYEYARSNAKDKAVTSSQLSLEQYAAILKYVAEDTAPTFYATLNGLCYSRENRGHLKAFVPYIWLLMHALQKLPPYPEPKVHRGVKLNLQSQFPKGKEFHWWSFVSTTKSIKVLEQEIFCGKSGPRTIFSITLRQRQARDISPFSPLAEGEVLLPPGCKFRVVDAADMGSGLTIIDLEELPSKMYVMDLSSHVASQSQHQHQHSSTAATATSAATSSSSSKPAAAAPVPLSAKGGGKSKPVQQADLSLVAASSSKGQQPLTQNQSQPLSQQQAAAASPASATAAAAAPSQTGGAKSPPAAATVAPPGAGKSAVFWYNLGAVEGGGRVEGQEYSKKACYEMALAINPKFPQAWQGLGVVGGGKVEGQEYTAKACYETALAIDPKYANAWNQLGFVGGGRVGEQEYSKKECYETALGIHPTHANAWNQLGFVGGGRVGGQEYSKKECYENALAINPKDAYAWNHLGRVGPL